MDFRTILDQLPDAIYVTDSSGITPIFFNKTWYEFTGLSHNAALEGWKTLVSPYDAGRVSKEIQSAVSKGEDYEVEVRLKRADGTYVWCLSKGRPVKDGNGIVEFYVGTSIDISDRKLAIRDLETVYNQALDYRQERIKELEKELEIHRSTT